jgi:hypothetical protein
MSVQASSRQSKAGVQAKKNWLSQTCLSILEIFGILSILEISLELLDLSRPISMFVGGCVERENT